MIYSLETERVAGKSGYQAAYDNTGSYEVDAELALATSSAFLVELFKSQLRDVAGLSAITAWGFTWSDLIVESNIHAFDFAGMNTSCVVSAGSRRRPCVDRLASDLDTHRVAGFDRFNAMPTNSDLLQGIGNTDALIEDFNFRMDEEQVRAAQSKACPCDSDKVSLKTSGRNGLNNKSKNNEPSETSGEPDRPWAVEKNIIHSIIFSQQPGLEGSRA